MPYRIDVTNPPEDAFDRLVDLGALDVELLHGRVAAIMSDSVAVETIASALGVDVEVTAARGRDDQSVWVLQPRAIRVGRLQIIPADWPPQPGALRMIDGPAFGTGIHPTTALCLEALHEELSGWNPASVLDIGTGTGILALAALSAGVPRAVALDLDADAIRVAAENARINGVGSRLSLVRGGPETLRDTCPLVLANVLAAPLIEMAPTLIRRVARSGRLVLSGIRAPVASDVESAYRRVGMNRVRTQSRGGWTALIFHASW
jgi:ribosomal protein L11 methyltransferase